MMLGTAPRRHGLGSLAGLLGAMLSAPLTVIVRDVLSHARADADEDVPEA